MNQHNQMQQMREVLRRIVEARNAAQHKPMASPEITRLWMRINEAQQALSHVNETPKNEHDSDDVLNKSGNVDMMREALQECLEVFEAIPAIVPTHIELITQAIETGQKVQQALAAEPEPLRFVQSDKGSVIVVINKGATLRHAYGVVVESTAYDNSPIEVADFVQEKDALLFAKIWNSALTELAEKPPLVRLTDEKIEEIGRKILDRGYPWEGLQPWVYLFAHAIMDAMERVNRRQLDQTPNSPSE